MSVRTFGLVAALLATSATFAQSPNVTFGLDLNSEVELLPNGKVRLRFHDENGNYSRVRFGASFDNGLSVRVFQKIERIDGDADASTLDEAYVERPGDWRAGKQYLPFGTGRIVKESALAAKIDMEILFADMPISLAFADAGSDRQRGFCARFGDNIGFSIAQGQRFGINASSFTQIRSAEHSPGKKRGYDSIIGADATKQTGGWTMSAEWVRLREGETAQDNDEDLLNGLVSYQFPYGPLVQIEATAQFNNRRLHYGFSAEVPISSNAFLSPSVRFLDGEGWHCSATLRVRL